MAEPFADLAAGLVTKWQASVSLQNVIQGPWRSERSADQSANPASGTYYPFCLFDGRASLEIVSCGREYYGHEVEFKIYNRTPELVAGHAATLKAVYDSDALTLTLSEGNLISHRPRDSRYVQIDKGVWYVSLNYYFQTSRPRVA